LLAPKSDDPITFLRSRQPRQTTLEQQVRFFLEAAGMPGDPRAEHLRRFQDHLVVHHRQHLQRGGIRVSRRSIQSRARTKRSIGFRTHAACCTAGNGACSGGTNDQCGR
jgi:hypothetical protein